MNLTLNEKFIMDEASANRFLAEELWIKNDTKFWAIYSDKQNKILYVTSGEYNEGWLDCGVDRLFLDNVTELDNMHDEIIDRLLENGFKCFAMRKV